MTGRRTNSGELTKVKAVEKIFAQIRVAKQSNHFSILILLFPYFLLNQTPFYNNNNNNRRGGLLSKGRGGEEL